MHGGSTIMDKDSTRPTAHAIPQANRQGLGITTKSASVLDQAMKWSTQEGARRLLPRERVAFCMRQVRQGVSGVDGIYVPATESAHYGGLVACGSVWHCPVCAAKITEGRRRDLAKAIANARAAGLRVVMCTYTFSHHRGDVLRVMLGKLTGAFRAMKSGRRSQEFRSRFGLVGTVRALEVTHSDDNGWHPHIHELVFLPRSINVEAFAVAARSAWEDAAGAKGLSMNEHGFQLDDCDAKVADYIAKYGHEPKWDESAELTKWHIKKGRALVRSSSEHLTPFGLLRYAITGDERAGALFVEYARAFKGKRQLFWSAGLRSMLDLEVEKTDQELAEAQEQEGIVLVHLTRPEWAIIVGNGCRAELLAEIRTGDPRRVFAFLGELGIYRDDIPDPEWQAA